MISLDDDGQAPLESLYELLDKLEEGYDVVYAYYNEIKQTAFRRFGTENGRGNARSAKEPESKQFLYSTEICY